MSPLICSHRLFNLYFVALVKSKPEYYDEHFPWQEKYHSDPQQWPSSEQNKAEEKKNSAEWSN